MNPHFELQQWTEDLRGAFAEMHADPAVMADLGGSLDRDASDSKFDRYVQSQQTLGISRWAIVASDSRDLLGYAGVTWRADPTHPLGAHHEIGWRLRRAAWGRGYATEAARRALRHAWASLPIREIVSYTSSDNIRSQKVMERLNLRRDPSRDFTTCYPRGLWSGLVWIEGRPASSLP